MEQVLLDYKLHRSPRRSDPQHADASTLRYQLFPGDLIVHVEGVDFSARWGWVPILDAALGLAYVVGELGMQETSSFAFTENDAHLRFRREHERVAVSADYCEGVATCSFEVLRAAVSAFLERVREQLTIQSPRLALNEALEPMVE